MLLLVSVLTCVSLFEKGEVLGALKEYAYNLQLFA